MLAVGALTLFGTLLGALIRPQPAQAFLGLDLSPAHWAVKGFVAILTFIFGNEIKKLADQFLHLLLNTPDITNQANFSGLNAYHAVVQGAAWGLLSLSFIAAVLLYWSSSYTANGADTAARAFGRTIGGIGMLVSLPTGLHLAITAMNQLTDGLIQNPIVGPSIGHVLQLSLTAGLASGGGLGLIIGIASLIAAIILLVTKIVTTALLAVLYILAPLAIGMWPFEPLSWALKTLAGAALALLVFPVVWSASFGVFAVITTDQIFGPSVINTLGHDLLSSLVGLAALIIAFKLPFAVLRLGMGAGLLPSPSRGIQTLYYARSAAAALAA
jgi:hypothetical protein